MRTNCPAVPANPVPPMDSACPQPALLSTGYGGNPLDARAVRPDKGASMIFRRPLILVSAWLAAALVARAAESAPEVSVFADKQLEAVVREQVFTKRHTDAPLTAADVATVSTIKGNGRGITSLAGLEHCKALAAAELAGNQITDLSPLMGLTRLQLLDLATNRISDLKPLAVVPALQFLELSHNQVGDLAPLRGLTNLASLYLAHNEVASLEPVTHLPRLVTLDLRANRLQSIAGLERLKRLSSLTLADNQITDLRPLTGLSAPSRINLERNRIRDFSPLTDWLAADLAGQNRFAAYLNLHVAGNWPTFNSRRLLAKWTKQGVRIQR